MMQILTHPPKGTAMSKTIARRLPRFSTTTKLLVGLTLFYFIGKTLGRH